MADSGQDLGECLCVHAEENALLQAAAHGVAVRGATLYCTYCPCSYCAKHIINAGLQEVVYREGYAHNTVTEALFKEAGLKLRKLRVAGGGRWCRSIVKRPRSKKRAQRKKAKPEHPWCRIELQPRRAPVGPRGVVLLGPAAPVSDMIKIDRGVHPYIWTGAVLSIEIQGSHQCCHHAWNGFQSLIKHEVGQIIDRELKNPKFAQVYYHFLR